MERDDVFRFKVTIFALKVYKMGITKSEDIKNHNEKQQTILSL